MDQQVTGTEPAYKSIMRNEANTLIRFNKNRLIDSVYQFADLSQALIDYNNLEEQPGNKLQSFK
jgi:hypothetical protein